MIGPIAISRIVGERPIMCVPVKTPSGPRDVRSRRIHPARLDKVHNSPGAAKEVS